MTGAVIAISSTSTGANSITGGAGDDTITGNTGTAAAGSAGDTLSGGSGADAITGISGDDSITGGAGNDTITLASDAAIDEIEFTGQTSSYQDTITGFVTTSDNLSFVGITVAGGGAITQTAGTAVTSGAVVAGALTNNSVYVISDVADQLTAAGVATVITSSNYTILATVATYLAEGYTSTADNDAAIFIINDLAADQSYIYLFDEATGAASTIQSADLSLIGVVTEVAGAALVSGDIA